MKGRTSRDATDSSAGRGSFGGHRLGVSHLRAVRPSLPARRLRGGLGGAPGLSRTRTLPPGVRGAARRGAWRSSIGRGGRPPRGPRTWTLWGGGETVRASARTREALRSRVEREGTWTPPGGYQESDSQNRLPRLGQFGDGAHASAGSRCRLRARIRRLVAAAAVGFGRRRDSS